MGRIKNAILDKQHDFENDLAELRQTLADKESAFIYFEMEHLFDSLRVDISFIKKRLDALEKEMCALEKEKKQPRVKSTKKQHIPTSIFALLSAITILTTLFYKYRK